MKLAIGEVGHDKVDWGDAIYLAEPADPKGAQLMKIKEQQDKKKMAIEAQFRNLISSVNNHMEKPVNRTMAQQKALLKYYMLCDKLQNSHGQSAEIEDEEPPPMEAYNLDLRTVAPSSTTSYKMQNIFKEKVAQTEETKRKLKEKLKIEQGRRDEYFYHQTKHLRQLIEEGTQKVSQNQPVEKVPSN
jgi:hypothetical protein